MSNETGNQKTIDCLYTNDTGKMAILRMHCMGQWLERVVVAGAEYLFKAPEEAYLEIYTCGMPTMILADKIACIELAVQGGTP